MLGRDNKLTVQGVGSSKVWRKELEKRNVAAGFGLVLQDDPYLPTDTTSFYPKRVPVLNLNQRPRLRVQDLDEAWIRISVHSSPNELCN